MKTSARTAGTVHKCKRSDKCFDRFFLLWELRRKEHGRQRGSGAQNDDVTHAMGTIDDNSLKEETETYKHFLVDSEMENGRHRVLTWVHSGSKTSGGKLCMSYLKVS